MKIFGSNAGKLVAMTSDAVPSVISISGFSPISCLVTSVGLGLACDILLKSSLNNVVYLYSFGDRMGQLVVAGVAFESGCLSEPSGAEYLLQWYASNRVSRSMTPVRVTFGGSTYAGFLEDFRLNMSNPEMRMYNWQATLLTLPDLNGIAAGSGSGSSESSGSGSGTSEPSGSTSGGGSTVANQEDGSSPGHSLGFNPTNMPYKETSEVVSQPWVSDADRSIQWQQGQSQNQDAEGNNRQVAGTFRVPQSPS
jgi:hypothetical protein